MDHYVHAAMAFAATVEALRARQPHPQALPTHYAVGMGPAAIYSATRKHRPGGLMSRGLLLGLGMFVVEDEVSIRSSEPPLPRSAIPGRRMRAASLATSLLALSLKLS